MKIKIFLMILFLAIAGAVTLSQVSVISAQEASPVTSPITSPITYFTSIIRGQITYRLFSFIVPAKGAIVVAKNLQTAEVYNQLADQNGQYSLTVKNGSYQVKVYDQYGTRFMPLERLIQTPASGSATFDSVDFQGYRKILPSPLR